MFGAPCPSLLIKNPNAVHSDARASQRLLLAVVEHVLALPIHVCISANVFWLCTLTNWHKISKHSNRVGHTNTSERRIQDCFRILLSAHLYRKRVCNCIHGAFLVNNTGVHVTANSLSVPTGWYRPGPGSVGEVSPTRKCCCWHLAGAGL